MLYSNGLLSWLSRRNGSLEKLEYSEIQESLILWVNTALLTPGRGQFVLFTVQWLPHIKLTASKSTDKSVSQITSKLQYFKS